MTPLAQALLNDWCRPKRDRKVIDPYRKSNTLLSAKCFECTELADFVRDIFGKSAQRQDVFKTGQVFSPAPVAVLEFKINDQRGGFLIEERSDGRLDIFDIYVNGIHPLGVLETSETFQRTDSVFKVVSQNLSLETATVLMQAVACYLCLINTPNLVGKITRLPHAGLQKKIASKRGMVGKFPLHAWTEISLCIDTTGRSVCGENQEVEARLSGQKCLHFVRSFLRWRLGRLERVMAHWRGDSSLGIKRSRYNVRPSP
jgi:hypothetical protein